MSEVKAELQKQFRQQQEKYVYYIIALAVSGIGFSVYQTSSQALKWSQIPLAIAIASWGFSIFCGLKFIKYVLSTTYANLDYLEILDGQHPELGNVAWKMEAGSKGVIQAMKKNIKNAGKYFSWQGDLFYNGIFFFIVWHITEMYLRGSFN